MDVHARLVALRPSTTSGIGLGALLRRRAVAIPIAATIVIGIVAGAWWWQSGAVVRDARRRLPEIYRLAKDGDSYGFFIAAHDVVRVLPEEQRLQELWTDLTIVMPSVKTTPPGAEVLTKGYDLPDDTWVSLGRTPIEDARFPRGTPRVKIVKDGYATYDGTISFAVSESVLDPISSAPAGMNRVPSAQASIEGHSAAVRPFWMDRFEVTNRQFKAFVEAGGYANGKYWQEPFVEDGHPLPTAVALARFRDQTGRPGPSTWTLGTYPEGQDEYPVGGVSWYEAAAFAVFAGKSLPTVFQWRAAGELGGPSAVYGDLLVHSNFKGKGPLAVGASGAIGPYGQFDMAGNVKEWCWNESRGGRMILGGGWNEPTYMYEDRDAQQPFTRLPTYGIRLVKNDVEQPRDTYALVTPAVRDFSMEKPIDDTQFAMARSIYAYDPKPLNARVDKIEEAAAWRRETISFDAAYGDERVITYLYLPKAGVAPYQTIVYFPGGDAQLIRSSRELNLTNVDFIVRGGRALMFPVYKGTYERLTTIGGLSAFRDLTIARERDFSRVVEYVFTRRDLDADRLGYYGASMGAFNGVIITALDRRVKASVLLGGGLSRSALPAEIDPFNFAPRVTAPTLMVNGTADFQSPLETTQRPLFHRLGPPADQKRHALFEGGHMPTQINDIMREILDWFDRFLGPVKTVTSGTN